MNMLKYITCNGWRETPKRSFEKRPMPQGITQTINPCNESVMVWFFFFFCNMYLM